MKPLLSLTLMMFSLGSIGTSHGQLAVTPATYPGLFGPVDDVTVDLDLSGALLLKIGGEASGSLGTYWQAKAEGGAIVGVNLGLIVVPLAETGAQVKLTGSALQFNINSDPDTLLGALNTGVAVSLGWTATATFNAPGAVATLQPESVYRVTFDVDAGSGLLNSSLAVAPSFGMSLLDGAGQPVGSSTSGTLVNILGLTLENVIGAPTLTKRATVKFKTGATVPAGAAGIRFTGAATLPAKILGIGTNFASISNLNLVYVDPYTVWIEDSGVTDPNQQGPLDDPDRDGRNNIDEFAVDSNPAVPDSNNVHVAIGDADGAGPETSVLVMTLPIRKDAAFTSDGPDLVAAIDGVSYRVEGSFELTNWVLAVSEVPGNSAFLSDLRTLPSGWTYRSFRVPGQTNASPRAFLRVKIN